jgi:hypothetical protein
MKRLAFLGFSLLAFFLPLTCQARLGDSIARLQQRYGRALGMRGNPKIDGMSWFIFKEEGYMFEAFMMKNTCEILIVSRQDKNELSQSECYFFLNRNSPDFKSVDISNPDWIKETKSEKTLFTQDLFNYLDENPGKDVLKVWEYSSTKNIAIYQATKKTLTFTSKKAQTLEFDPFGTFESSFRRF